MLSKLLLHEAPYLYTKNNNYGIEYVHGKLLMN